MRPALKGTGEMTRGVCLETSLGGERILLDPGGVLLLADQRVLVVSDLHLEKGASLARRGVFLPPYDTAATLAQLTALVAKHDPAMIVSLGDSFHDARASGLAGDDTVATITALARGRDLVWVTGNHDPAPHGTLPGTSADMLAMGGIVLRHIADPASTMPEISGHYHPAAVLAARGKAIRRACFAFDGVRLVMPAFGVFTGGMNIREREVMRLFRRADLVAYMLGTDRVYPIAGRDLC